MSMERPLCALIETMIDLIRLMEEESELLALSGPAAGTATLAQAKIRLASRMEAQCAALHRANSGWMAALNGDERRAFTEASEDLHKAATVNSAILERQIDLSSAMLATIGHELERVAGRRGTTYSRSGAVHRVRSSPPLSLNGKF